MAITVDYMLTARCNLHCPFCYGPPPEMRGELNLDAKCFLIDALADQGVTHLVFSGGEPLLSADAAQVFERAYRRGLKVGLHTNGFVFERLRRVLPLLDWLALPIDGVSPAVQRAMRTSPLQLEYTKRAVRLVRAEGRPGGTRIKIGTVVSRLNVHELDLIADEVERIAPDSWKLHEVRPRGAAVENLAMLELARSTMAKATNSVRSKYPGLPMLRSYGEQSRNAYVIINPDSEALVPQLRSYTSAGRLLVSQGPMKFDLSVWNAAVRRLDPAAHRSNMRGAFPGWIDVVPGSA